jgi:hypothetical protein
MRGARLITSLLTLTLLSGCELAAMGPLMPGLLPGVGFPLTGIVRDARTYLPVGGATVYSGLGTTVTDAEGKFSLYGNMASREISVSRAGYVAKTLGGQKLEPGMTVDFTLDPVFNRDGKLPMGFLDIQGKVVTPTGQIASPDGLVSFAGKPAPVANGAFQVRYESQVPGKLFSSVLAGGRIAGRYEEGAKVFQPFNFETFGYQLVHFTVGETYPQGLRTDQNLVVGGEVPFSTVRVNYTNLSGLNTVQTSVFLDFGVAGSVLVAQATASNQTIKVPSLPGVKYVVSGEAFNDSQTQSSAVTITTTNPSQAPFQMLTPPKVLAPAPGASRAGARPTFRWSESTVKGLLYEITLFEGDEKDPGTTAKWTASTTESEITYPGFSLSDVNGGALRPDKKYSWVVRAIDVLAPTEDATHQRRTLDVKPLRSRKREATSRGNTFSI